MEDQKPLEVLVQLLEAEIRTLRMLAVGYLVGFATDVMEITFLPLLSLLFWTEPTSRGKLSCYGTGWDDRRSRGFRCGCGWAFSFEVGQFVRGRDSIAVRPHQIRNSMELVRPQEPQPVVENSVILRQSFAVLLHQLLGIKCRDIVHIVAQRVPIESVPEN